MEANTEYPVHTLIEHRWSPYAFSDKPVEREKLHSLMEAARWAPSSYNEQPWNFVLGFKGKPSHDAILSLLVEFNREWAQHAPIVGISCTRTYFQKNNKPNRHCYHDVGLAMGGLILEAVAHGLCVHQMAGFDHEGAKSALSLPEGHEAVAAFAIGYLGDPPAEKDQERRPRRSQSEFLFEGAWNQPLH